MIVNGAMEVVQFRGRTTPYLGSAPRKPTPNLLKLAQTDLAIELRSLINAAKKKGALVTNDHVAFEVNGRKRLLKVSVTPLGEKRAPARGRHFLILFEDIAVPIVPGSKYLSPEKTKTAEKKGEFKPRSAIESERTVKDGIRCVI